MIPQLPELLFFVSASLVLIVAPGPDIIFLITQGIGGGRTAGLQTAGGLAAGNLVHTLGAALGVSVIFQTSAAAFTVLKIGGACYLFYLAIKAVLSRNELLETINGGDAAQTSLFWKGLLMNVLNPKVALFFLAFLPQFADAARGPVWMQMIFFGLLFTVLVLIVFGFIGTFAGMLRGWLTGGSGKRFQAVLPWGTAGIFTLLGLKLVCAER